MAKKIRSYSAKDITVLDQMEGVRQHPAMYIGAIDGNGTFQCFKEIADNCADELKDIGGGKILIRIKGDTVVVADSGRGVPVDVVKKTGLSALETVFTRLHAGAKAGDKTAYGKTTIGVHGVGAAVVNALSTKFEAWTCRKGKWWHQEYAKGKPSTAIKKAEPPVEWAGGTVVRYKLDKTKLEYGLDHAAVKSYCRLLSHFAPISIKLIVEGEKTIYKPRPVTELLTDSLKEVGEEQLGITFVHLADGVRCVLAWSASTDNHVKTYVAGSPTSGGTHATGFYRVLEEAFRQVFKKAAGDGRDYTLGLHAVLDVSINQPSFEGQAKTRLATKGAAQLVEEALLKPLVKHIKMHKGEFQKVVDHVKSVGEAILAARETVKLASSVKEKSRGTSQLPLKLMPAPSASPDKRELYLLEGDSAAGTARKARMPWQEALPLRGKLPNLVRDGRKALTNQEVHDIIRCMGYDPKKPDGKLRVARLFLLADADVDGDHISVLMLTLIYKVMPELFRDARVYIVQAPLFVAEGKGGQHVYANSLKEIKKQGGVKHVERMKGWGACSPELLRTLAFDPKTRNVVRVRQAPKKEARAFEALMGPNSEHKKELVGLAG